MRKIPPQLSPTPRLSSAPKSRIQPQSHSPGQLRDHGDVPKHRTRRAKIPRKRPMNGGFFASLAEPRGGSRPRAGRLRGLTSHLVVAEKEKKSSSAGYCHKQSDYQLLESKACSRCSRCIKRQDNSLSNKSRIRVTDASSRSPGCARQRLGTSSS